MANRSNPAIAQAEALRALAAEVEAGTRALSPTLAKALDRELARVDDSEREDPSSEEWEAAWAHEIDERLGAFRAGKAHKVDLGALLDDLAGRLR